MKETGWEEAGRSHAPFERCRGCACGCRSHLVLSAFGTRKHRWAAQDSLEPLKNVQVSRGIFYVMVSSHACGFAIRAERLHVSKNGRITTGYQVSSFTLVFFMSSSYSNIIINSWVVRNICQTNEETYCSPTFLADDP